MQLILIFNKSHKKEFKYENSLVNKEEELAPLLIEF